MSLAQKSNVLCTQQEETENIQQQQTDNISQSLRKRMRYLPSISDGATNVTFQQHKVSREQRSVALGRHEGFRGCTIWFTGLSGAGKTTISFALEKTLIHLGLPAYGLDGDNVRHGLCKNLGFKKDDRAENIRRVAEVSSYLQTWGKIHESDGLKFFEIHVNTPLHVCEERDTKKLYKKARAGELKGFTGIDSVYEIPEKPDLVLNCGSDTEAHCVQKVLQFLYDNNVLPEKAMHQLCGQPVHELFVSPEEAATKSGHLEVTPSIELTLVDLQWLQVLSEGWATPLTGFMRERQYLQCLHHGQLFDLEKLDPLNQSIPIVLPITDQQKARLLKSDGQVVESVRLLYKGQLVALLYQPEVYAHRKQERIHRQFGYSDLRHPAIKLIHDSGDWLLGEMLR
uniref:Adenylyl-sulfate kinase n=1 Tax=Ditylenchus dipsaci TaxID=166011 RepID=A0A915CUL3_9BILA